MPITAVFVLVGIVLAFAVFALVLAWGDYQTRNISHSSRQSAGTSLQARGSTTTAADFGQRGSVREEAQRGRI
jgi:ABC-type phosphate transport system substrate-binding protein